MLGVSLRARSDTTLVVLTVNARLSLIIRIQRRHLDLVRSFKQVCFQKSFPTLQLYLICLQSLASQTEDRNALCKLKRLNVNLQQVTPCCLQTVSLPHITCLRCVDVDDIETVGKVRLAYFFFTNFCFLNLSYKYKIKQTYLYYYSSPVLEICPQNRTDFYPYGLNSTPIIA